MKESNVFIEKLLVGENLPIGNFVVKDMKELSIERFHALKNDQERIQIIREMKRDLQMSREKEKQVFKLLESLRLNAGKTYTKSRDQDYDNDINYLKALESKPWTFLPRLARNQQKKLVPMEKSEIDSKTSLQIKFKRFVGIKAEKFRINYNLEVDDNVNSYQAEC